MSRKPVKKKNISKAENYKPARNKSENLNLLLLIIFAGFILRLFFVLETKNSPFITNLYSDSKIYFEWAKEIIDTGNWLGDEVFFMSPGYPYFLAVIFNFFGDSVSLIRILQTILSALNIYLIFLIARILFSKQSALLSAGIAALYSVFIFYSGLILSETLQTLLVTYLIYILIKPTKDYYRKWLFSGIILGISALFRANILLLIVFLLPYVLLKNEFNPSVKVRLKMGLLFLTGVSLIILPVSLRNYIVENDFVLITSNGGINFYLGNNQNATGVYNTPKDFDFFTDMAGKSYAEKITGIEMSASETSAFWFRQGFEYILNNPEDAAVLTLKKFFLFFDDSENPQSSIMNPEFFSENYSNLLKLPLPGFYFIIILAIPGIVFSWRDKKKYGIIYLFLLSYILSVVIFFVIGRFRVAVTPVLIIFAGYAAEQFYKLYTSKDYRKLFAPVLITVIFLSAQQIIAPVYSYSNYEAYTNIGSSKLQEGKFNEALFYLNKSIELKETEQAYVLLGNAYSAMQKWEESFRAYNKALTINPDYAMAYFHLGTYFVRRNDLQNGEKYFLKAIEIDPLFSEAYRNLAVIYYIREDYRKSLEYFQKYLDFVEDPVVRGNVINDIENLKMKIDQQGK
ncbi:MAG: tetratricopeptide repeat protein [Ignavibacteriaceae bacterium]